MAFLVGSHHARDGGAASCPRTAFLAHSHYPPDVGQVDVDGEGARIGVAKLGHGLHPNQALFRVGAVVCGSDDGDM